MIALGCVTGRFQPVHGQHLELFEIVLARCQHLIIAVTNPDAAARHPEAASAHRHTQAANPFTYFERAQLLQAALIERGIERGLALRATIVPFDLTRPAQWPHYVPLSAQQFVRVFDKWGREKAARLAQAGYGVTLLDGDAAHRQSAADMRASMVGGDDRWRGLAPPGTVPLLMEFLVQAPIRSRG